jgi:peptide/nickel transport system substrate-binding protein
MDAQGNFVGDLATRWTHPDPHTYVFDIVDGVRFHNGDKLTADDVKYSVERVLNPKIGSQYASSFGSLAGVEVVNPTRVAFHFGAPFEPFLTGLALAGQIVNRREIEQKTSGRNPVGSGAFRFAEWVHGDHIALARNTSYYHKGLPYLDGVRFTWQPVSAALVEALRAKQQNYIYEIPAQLVRVVDADPAFNYISSTLAGKPRFLAFNLDAPPVNNPKLRQAIAWAIDRNEVQRIAFLNAGQPGSEEVGTGSRWYDDQDPYKLTGPDLTKARQLLRESGLKPPIHITFLAETSSPYATRVGQIVQQQLAPLGIVLSVQQLDVSVWLNKFVSKKYQMSMAYEERTIDPDNLYSLLLVSNAAENVFGYKNSRFDAAIAAARQASTFPQRKQLYTEARRYLWQDVPIFYIHYDSPQELTNRSVIGAAVGPTLELNLQEVGFAA